MVSRAVGKPVEADASVADNRLDGLLIVSVPEPTREWVRWQFREFSALTDGRQEAFLPNVFRAYTDRIVLRLVDLLQETDGSLRGRLLSDPRHKESAPSGRARETHCLECYLREPSDLASGPMPPRAGRIDRDAAPKLLLIHNGRLREMSVTRQAARDAALFLLLILITLAVLGWASSRKPDPIAVMEPKTLLDAAVEWLARVFQGRPAGSFVRGGARRAPPRREEWKCRRLGEGVRGRTLGWPARGVADRRPRAGLRRVARGALRSRRPSCGSSRCRTSSGRT